MRVVINRFITALSRATIYVTALMLASTSLLADSFKDPQNFDPKFAPSMIELTIPYEGVRMTGLMYSAAGQGPHPTIILLHAFPGFEKNLDMAQALRRQGYNILFFHYRGTWGSGGNYSWSGSLHDVHTAIDYLKRPENIEKYRVDIDQIHLVGHSWGGMLSLKAGGKNPNIHCIVSIAPEDWTQWLDTEADRQSIIDYLDGIYSVQGYPSQTALNDLIKERAEWTLNNIAKNVGNKKTLLISAQLDAAFDTNARERVSKQARLAGTNNLTSFTIDKADHSFSAKRIELIERTSKWLNQNCKAK
ncbi:MAG: alpha/beta hydrolase family protein [Kordiimonas sp.]